jgi:hypothetical protein
MHIVRTDDAWSVGRSDGMTCRPDEWNSGQMGVWTADKDFEIFCLESSAETSETLLNSGIPVKKHLYKQLILSKHRMRPQPNKNL